MDEARLEGRMLLQVHDELIFESPPDEMETLIGLVLEVMPAAMDLVVPLKVASKQAPRPPARWRRPGSPSVACPSSSLTHPDPLSVFPRGDLCIGNYIQFYPPVGSSRRVVSRPEP